MLLPAAKRNTILSAANTPFLRLFGPAFLRAVCILFAIVALLSLHVQAQEPTTDDEVVRVSTDLLVFPIRIRDKRTPAGALTERDLLLRDDDHVTSGLYLYPGC